MPSDSEIKIAVQFHYNKKTDLKDTLVTYVQLFRKWWTSTWTAVIQSFGSHINFHPHLYFLVTEGGTDKKGQFHKVSLFNDPLLCRFFTLEVFSLLLEKKLINKDLVQKILHWRHTGFNVHP